MALDDNRRALLERSRAQALLRDNFSVDPSSLTLRDYPFGIVAMSDDRTFVVSMSDDLAVLGGVLVWADRQMPHAIELVVDHHGGIHCRRSAVLAPEITVWTTVGATLTAAVAAPIDTPLPWPLDTGPYEQQLRAAGLEVVCENGIVRGEIAGLEVARLVAEPEGMTLQVGVGRFDREAAVLLHQGRPSTEALAHALDLIRPHRVRGAASHAINRIGRERWLRAEVVADPGTVGLVDPVAVEPIPPRLTLLEDAPASLLGDDDGLRILVVCSVGSDLGLVPAIADLLTVHRPDEVRIVLPARDRLPHVERLVSRIPVPTKIVGVEPPWAD